MPAERPASGSFLACAFRACLVAPPKKTDLLGCGQPLKCPHVEWAELWANPQALKGGEDCFGDCGSPVRAPELARFDACGEGPIHRSFDAERCRLRLRVAMFVTEPIEHHGRREDHGNRIGKTLARNVGGGAMTGLKYRMRVAGIRRRRHAHSANEAGGKIGEDIANMFSITITSKSHGRRTNMAVQAST